MLKSRRTTNLFCGRTQHQIFIRYDQRIIQRSLNPQVLQMTLPQLFFSLGKYLGENPKVLFLISRMVPRVNHIFLREKGKVNDMAQNHQNNILIMSSTCRSKAQNLAGEDITQSQNHSRQTQLINLPQLERDVTFILVEFQIRGQPFLVIFQSWMFIWECKEKAWIK